MVALTRALLPLLKKSAAGRIVNVSSILGSLTLHATPGSPIYGAKMFAYDASKTALNAYTIHLAHALKETKIKVNSAHPGWVKTELGGEGAPMEIVDGAKTSVRLATLPTTAPPAATSTWATRCPGRLAKDDNGLARTNAISVSRLWTAPVLFIETWCASISWRGQFMNRRSFLQTAATLTAPLAILPDAIAQAAGSPARGNTNNNPQTESARRIELATAAALAMQRRDWEQGPWRKRWSRPATGTTRFC